MCDIIIWVISTTSRYLDSFKGYWYYSRCHRCQNNLAGTNNEIIQVLKIYIKLKFMYKSLQMCINLYVYTSANKECLPL